MEMLLGNTTANPNELKKIDSFNMPKSIPPTVS